MNPTIDAYDHSAREFAERNWNVHPDAMLDTFARRLKPGGLVLDLGCGPGRDVALLRGRGFRVAGMDLSTGMLTEAQRRVGGVLVCSDMRRIPMATASVDGVWACASLLHLQRQDAAEALSEARRVLRPGGILYVSVKLGEGERWDERFGRRFFTYYQPDELAALVTASEFAIEQLELQAQATQAWIEVIALAR